MLRIVIPNDELWDEARGVFIPIKGGILQLEHSLVSLSKWESKWNKPFLTKQEKSSEETLDYIKCMTLTSNVDQKLYEYLTMTNIEEINNYIAEPMTATYFSDIDKKTNNGEQVTSEIIYYWMIELKIPFECQKWHLNRLLTLIRVCSIKNQPAKKMSKKELMNRNAALNAARKKKLNTKG